MLYKSIIDPSLVLRRYRSLLYQVQNVEHEVSYNKR